jgi:hypothetical protein
MSLQAFVTLLQRAWSTSLRLRPGSTAQRIFHTFRERERECRKKSSSSCKLLRREGSESISGQTQDGEGPLRVVNAVQSFFFSVAANERGEYQAGAYILYVWVHPGLQVVAGGTHAGQGSDANKRARNAPPMESGHPGIAVCGDGILFGSRGSMSPPIWPMAHGP